MVEYSNETFCFEQVFLLTLIRFCFVSCFAVFSCVAFFHIMSACQGSTGSRQVCSYVSVSPLFTSTPTPPISICDSAWLKIGRWKCSNSRWTFPLLHWEPAEQLAANRAAWHPFKCRTPTLTEECVRSHARWTSMRRGEWDSSLVKHSSTSPWKPVLGYQMLFLVVTIICTYGTPKQHLATVAFCDLLPAYRNGVTWITVDLFLYSFV